MFLSSKNNNAKTLEVPSEALENPTWLMDFPELSELFVDSFVVGDETYNYIKKNTNIKSIKSSLLFTRNMENLVNSPNQMLISWGVFALQYQDGDLSVENTTYDPNSITVELYDMANDLPLALEKLKKYSNISRLNVIDGQGVSLTYDKNFNELKYTDSIHPEVLKKFCSILEQAGYHFSSVKLCVINETYPNFYALKGLDEKYDFTINYGSYTTTSYEDFLYMRETIDYYKALINTYNLSPLEKIMYAYDLMKSYKYNETSKHSSTSRNIPEIIRSGEIVCIGYSTFFKQLLFELGIEAQVIDVTIKENERDEYHARNIVHVDDDKYNVHGDFVFDSTWDSYKELYKVRDKDGKESVKQQLEETDEIIEKIDRLPLYRYFLVPARDYTTVFKSEDLPRELKNDENDYHKRLYLEQQYEVEKPDLETFKQILSNVRLAEGYSKEMVGQEIDNVVFVNEYICNNYTHIPFFESPDKNSKLN